MIVKQIWTANAYRNFNYLVACPETGEALAVDPLDHEKCLKAAQDAGWTITQILNTHEHGDHTGGNGPVVEKTGAKILAPERKDRYLHVSPLPRASSGSESVEPRCSIRPTHDEPCACARIPPALFCGDTFNAGAGTHNGGHPEALYATFTEQLARLPDDTLIYPGHDYIENNLCFTLNREPDNRRAQEMLERIKGQDANRAYVSTIGVEREINTFFRLTSATVIAQLRLAFPDLPEKLDPRTVFLKLRELRNRW
jgi:hydroxyacylglutathione hydrolase